MPPNDAPPVITLTTDFGAADHYVAAMKGALLSINPRTTIVDITHEVRPQRIEQGAFVTQAVWPYFPSDAIHVAVVDPGVGSERRALVLETPDGRFVGPDNGVLSAALADAARPEAPASVPLPQGVRAFALTNRAYMLDAVSATFHGRDVFAPAAAHLSLGVALEEMGEAVESIVALPPLRARRRDDGALAGHVLHIDRFSNAITDVRAEDVPEGGYAVEVAGRVVRGPVRTYAEADGLVALAGSSGYVELALAGGSAAGALGVDIGDEVIVRA